MSKLSNLTPTKPGLTDRFGYSGPNDGDPPKSATPLTLAEAINAIDLGVDNPNGQVTQPPGVFGEATNGTVWYKKTAIDNTGWEKLFLSNSAGEFVADVVHRRGTFSELEDEIVPEGVIFQITDRGVFMNESNSPESDFTDEEKLKKGVIVIGQKIYDTIAADYRDAAVKELPWLGIDQIVINETDTDPNPSYIYSNADHVIVDFLACTVAIGTGNKRIWTVCRADNDGVPVAGQKVEIITKSDLANDVLIGNGGGTLQVGADNRIIFTTPVSILPATSDQNILSKMIGAKSTFPIVGPYANDAAAATAGVAVGEAYYLVAGGVVVRLV